MRPEQYEDAARLLEGEANAHEHDAITCRFQAEQARKVAQYIRKQAAHASAQCEDK